MEEVCFNNIDISDDFFIEKILLPKIKKNQFFFFYNFQSRCLRVLSSVVKMVELSSMNDYLEFLSRQPARSYLMQPTSRKKGCLCFQNSVIPRQ